MAVVRKLAHKRGWAYTAAIAVVKPTLLTISKRNWIGGENIPATGGCVLAVNHISKIDPLTLSYFVYNHGRIVRFLAKDGLWNVPVLKNIMDNAKQIPVPRMSGGAAGAVSAAVEAVRAGECVGLYVEGSITRDPDGWPMRGKTGAAHIALATGCPVIPIGQWGAQDILPAYSLRPSVFPRHTTSAMAGEPVDLSEFKDQPLTSEVLHAATDTIMEAVTGLVEALRGEQAPAVRFDPKASGISEIGNYRKDHDA